MGAPKPTPYPTPSTALGTFSHRHWVHCLMFFRPLPIAFSLLAALLVGAALAQAPAIRGPLREVRIEGATANEDLIRTLLVSRPGTPAERVDLEAERNLVYSLGYYAEVSVNLEDRGSGPILVVRVKENPKIDSLEFDGVTLTDPANFVRLLAQQHLLEPGRILNTVEAEKSVGTVQQVYRQNGFPFDVPVALQLEPVPAEDEPTPAEDAPVKLVYTVTETEPVREVAFQGNTVLSDEALQEIFAPLTAAGSFDIQSYQAAVEEVNARYRELGYRDSGVYPPATNLDDGTLTVGIRELRVAGFDTSAIGIDASELSLEPGDLYNYDVLLEDIKRLSAGRSSDISLADPLILSNGQVRVTFLSGPPETAGPIEEVRIEGNTVIPTDELLPLLTLEPGDTFTSALAAEDFARIAQYYASKGYALAATPNFSYLDGSYVQRLTELKIAGYELRYDKPSPKTQDFVVERYLPEPGSVLNQNQLRDSLIRVARLGIVEPVSWSPSPTDTPGEVTVVVELRERPTGTFGPEASYDTQKGFSANLSYSDTNFLGRAHNFSVSLSAQTSDIGFLLGGSVDYSIPWLYLDALDFQQVPTSVSGSLFSTVDTNRSLTDGGQLRVCYDPADRENGNDCPDDEKVFVGEYTKRESGLGFSVGRQVFPDTTLRVSARGSYSAYYLEPERPCELGDDGKIANALTCTLPEAEALPTLPQSGWSGTVSGILSFDNRNDPDFPTAGVSATGSVGLGFGNDYRDPATGQQTGYSYVPVEFGVRTYVPLASIAPDAISDPNHVLAFKLNLGHQFGGGYPVDRYFRVGQTLSDSTLIRGYDRSDFNPSQTYAIGTVEYRYDFHLSTVATQTVIGIAWVDLGWASSVPGFDLYGAPPFMSAGIGVQVNLGFTALGFFPLRFDYGFSQRHPGGVLSFRVGPVF